MESSLESYTKYSKSPQAKISRNERKKGNKYREKFGYKIPKNSREVLLLEKKNGNTLWGVAISEQMITLQKLGVFQLYPPKTKFEKKDGWEYAPMHIIFDVKQQDLGHKARIVVGGYFVQSTEHTTLYTTTDVYLILMILIYVQNELGLMAGDIVNSLFTAPFA